MYTYTEIVLFPRNDIYNLQVVDIDFLTKHLNCHQKYEYKYSYLMVSNHYLF